jgi:uncharacterized protein YbcV (DUF1398 family)
VFTEDQIKAAHSRVKSGADFPAYIQEIRALGVSQYETYVTDGHIDYHGSMDFNVRAPAKYDSLLIADLPDELQFKSGLEAHQQGKTDFLSFIRMCAACGIEKWEVRMDTMTCTYFDKSGNIVLAEDIPQ